MISLSLHMSSFSVPISLYPSIRKQVHSSPISRPNRNRFQTTKSSDQAENNGVVDAEDMEGFLDSLSLEYDTVWDTKPWWCQPWTITLTGISVISLSWVGFRSVELTFAAAALIFSWWYVFLYSYPKAYSEMIAERRKRGLEDTYGRTGAD